VCPGGSDTRQMNCLPRQDLRICRTFYFTRVNAVPSRSRLRSSNSDQLIVPSFNLTTVGRRAFPVSAANLWNSLPAHLTLTFLFRRFYPDLIIRHSIELTSYCGPTIIVGPGNGSPWPLTLFFVLIGVGIVVIKFAICSGSLIS